MTSGTKANDAAGWMIPPQGLFPPAHCLRSRPAARHANEAGRGRRFRTPGVPALAAAVAFAALSAIVPSSASATHTACWREARRITDDQGIAFTYRYHCSTYVSSPVYGNPYGTAPLDDSGYMYANHDVWVVCQKSGRPNPTIQGNTNTYWLYTQGDLARSNAYGYRYGWGWLPATAVSQGGQNQPIPGVPLCARWY
ncbi:MAG: hypothetical protein LC808_06500 [Actinobacteria bacterium]|nr:hypothetical protein [Actinomycetota bacterium]